MAATLIAPANNPQTTNAMNGRLTLEVPTYPNSGCQTRTRDTTNSTCPEPSGSYHSGRAHAGKLHYRELRHEDRNLQQQSCVRPARAQRMADTVRGSSHAEEFHCVVQIALDRQRSVHLALSSLSSHPRRHIHRQTRDCGALASKGDCRSLAMEGPFAAEAGRGSLKVRVALG
jgi:hypothetical protein